MDIYNPINSNTSMYVLVILDNLAQVKVRTILTCVAEEEEKEKEEKYHRLSATLQYTRLFKDSFVSLISFRTAVTSCSFGKESGLIQSSSS
jgi:hypothetical protein